MKLLVVTLLLAISYAQTDYERCFIREPNKSCTYTTDINIGDNGNRFTVGTEAECAEVCWAHEDCVAFNYVHSGRHSGGYQGTGTGTCYYRSGQLANQHHSDVRSCHVRDPACDPSAPVSEVQCDSGISGETTDDEHSATYAFTADQVDYVFDTCGTDWDTMLTILDSNGDELFFNDDHESACPDGNNQYASHLAAQLTPGSQYTLKINGYCASCYGAYTINVACPGVAQNAELKSTFEKAAAAFQVVGNTDNAITVLAMIGALTMMYYIFKGIRKMMFATSDFQKINEDEIECYSS